MAKLLAIPYVRSYQVEGKENDFVLTMCPVQSLLLKAADMVEMDVTYQENKELPKMLHFCTFSQ